jgi:hypothetical protein
MYMSRYFIPQGVNGRPATLAQIAEAQQDYVSLPEFVASEAIQLQTDSAQTTLINQLTTTATALTASVASLNTTASGLSASVANLQTHDIMTDASVSSHTTTLTSHGNRLTAIETTNTSQDTSIATANLAIASKQSQITSANRLGTDLIQVSGVGTVLTSKLNEWPSQ